MNFISSAAFWGMIIVLFGLSIILREIFHISFPIFRVFAGCLLIYLGIRIIAGGINYRHGGRHYEYSDSYTGDRNDKREYNIIFGSGNIDLFKIELPDKNRTLEVNVIFGDGKLILNDSIPTRVDISAALGSVHTPDRTTNGLGNSVYTTSSYRENIPFIRIKASAVFGKLIIENKRW